VQSVEIYGVRVNDLRFMVLGFGFWVLDSGLGYRV
jgi:hypothetical protein